MKEIWKDIVYEGINYEGYQVSNWGRVKTFNYLHHNGVVKIMKQNKVAGGYMRVVLYKDGKRHRCMVHRLVAEAFIPNPENKPCVDHINTIRTDNRVENLVWKTHKENSNNPLTREHISKSTMNNKRSKTVIQYTLDGEFVREYPSANEVQRQNEGFWQGGVSACCRGKIPQYRDFIFKYKERVD